MSDPRAFRDASALITAIVSDDTDTAGALLAEVLTEGKALDTINALAVWAGQVVRMHARLLRMHQEGMRPEQIMAKPDEELVDDFLEVVRHVALELERHVD